MVGILKIAQECQTLQPIIKMRSDNRCLKPSKTRFGFMKRLVKSMDFVGELDIVSPETSG